MKGDSGSHECDGFGNGVVNEADAVESEHQKKQNNHFAKEVVTVLLGVTIQVAEKVELSFLST